MGFYYLNFSKATPKTPWIVSETNEDRTKLFLQIMVEELEINVPCKTFVGKFHYFQCEGELTRQGTKAVINPVK